MILRGTTTGLVLAALLAGCSGNGSDSDDSDDSDDAGVVGVAGATDAGATGTAADDPAAGDPSGPLSPASDERPADDGAGPDAALPGAGTDDSDAPPDAAVDSSSPSPGSVPADADTAGDGATASTSAPAPDGAPPEDPGPAPQPGVLTAGDHDDQLNPERYRDYATRYLQSAGDASGLPFVDLTRRVTVAVTDADGAPFAGARVVASSGDIVYDRVVTPADGIVHLLPELGLGGDDFLLSVQDRLGDVRESVSVRPEDLEASRRIEVRLPATSVPATALDLALVIDTTGSMGDELAYLQAELSSIVGRVADAYPGTDVRVGFVAYRDEGDEYVVRSTDLTDDIPGTRATLAAERADGGGDYPEAMDRAMVAALALGWRRDAVKVMLLVADAPAHADRTSATFVEALRARGRMIHVVPVAASGVAGEAQYLMRAMAAVTQARYLFLTDDSGVGLPHETPDIACYLVTRLDGLIVRTVRSLVEGVRVEPSQDEILRRVGDYDEGRCLEGGQ